MKAQEVIRKINVLSKPLLKHKYVYEDVGSSPLERPREGSSLLFDVYNEIENEVEEEGRIIDELLEEVREEAAEEVPNKRFKKLRKPNFSIFDYSEVEYEKMENEISAVINADGYYDDIVPFDDGAEELYKRKIDRPKIIVLVMGILSILATFGFLYIKFLR